MMTEPLSVALHTLLAGKSFGSAFIAARRGRCLSSCEVKARASLHIQHPGWGRGHYGCGRHWLVPPSAAEAHGRQACPYDRAAGGETLAANAGRRVPGQGANGKFQVSALPLGKELFRPSRPARSCCSPSLQTESERERERGERERERERERENETHTHTTITVETKHPCAHAPPQKREREEERQRNSKREAHQHNTHVMPPLPPTLFVLLQGVSWPSGWAPPARWAAPAAARSARAGGRAASWCWTVPARSSRLGAA